MKEDVLQDLPPKVVQDYYCTMSPLQLKLYDSFTNTEEGQHALDIANNQNRSGSTGSLFRSSSKASGSGKTRGGFQSVKYLLALCNHPCLVLTPQHPLYRCVMEDLASGGKEWGVPANCGPGLNDVQLSGKLVALRQLLRDCGFGTDGRYGVDSLDGSIDDDEESADLMSQHRALIFFQTKKMLSLVTEVLRSEFQSVAYLRLDGSVAVQERQQIVTRFNEDPSIDMLLLTTSVGGLGLNLTGADTVIFVEHDWNPCKDLQAMDRAHRIGQRRMVNVYRLITADSIEERIMNLQAFKTHLARALVSQPANSSLAKMDTSHLLDSMATDVANRHDPLIPAATVKSVSGGTDDLDEVADDYANMEDFLTHLPPPSPTSRTTTSS